MGIAICKALIYRPFFLQFSGWFVHNLGLLWEGQIHQSELSTPRQNAEGEEACVQSHLTNQQQSAANDRNNTCIITQVVKLLVDD